MDKNILVKWLKNAHAMEESIENVLQEHIEDAKDHEQISSSLKEHLEITRSQAQRVKDEIERLGGEVSKSKSKLADWMGKAQGITTGSGEDKLVKNATADYATEHFEIATYTAIATAAEKLGESQTAQLCQEIIDEEKQMAAWLDKQLPSVVEDYLSEQ